MRIAIDAMGSDRAPGPEVAAAVQVARTSHDLTVVLVGDRARLVAELAGSEVENLELRDAREVVAMHDHPVAAVRGKPRSSLRVAMQAVIDGDADAFVSAGNSGAVLAAATLLVGKLPGIERPAVVTELPVGPHRVILCDAGANVDPKPAMLAQFARIGLAYFRATRRGTPRVGLLANGAEPTKGTDLTRAAHTLLTSAMPEFVGYVEANDLFGPESVDIVATDGFTGNVLLKTVEGLTGTSYAAIGGALLAGVARPVLLAHGRSDATALANAIRTAARFVRDRIVDRLAEA